jgi:hypothetical protein
MLNLIEAEGTVASSIFRIGNGPDEPIHTERRFTFSRIETTTWPYVRDVAAVREDYDFAVLLNVPYLNARLYVLNLPDNAYDLLRLPPEVLNKIRSAFNKQMGGQLQGHGGVGLYPFGAKQYVIYNMKDESAHVALSFSNKMVSTGWQELVHGKSLAVSDFKGPENNGEAPRTEVSLTLQSFEIAIVQAP